MAKTCGPDTLSLVSFASRQRGRRWPTPPPPTTTTTHPGASGAASPRPAPPPPPPPPPPPLPGLPAPSALGWPRCLVHGLRVGALVRSVPVRAGRGLRLQRAVHPPGDLAARADAGAHSTRPPAALGRDASLRGDRCWHRGRSAADRGERGRRAGAVAGQAAGVAASPPSPCALESRRCRSRGPGGLAAPDAVRAIRRRRIDRQCIAPWRAPPFVSVAAHIP